MKFVLIVFLFSLTFSQQIDFNDYNRILKTYVDDFGRVNYKRMVQNEKTAMNKLLTQISKKNPLIQPNLYRENNDELAAWINIYNILVLNEVVTHYPIESIQDIDNVWKKKQNLGNFKLSLDEIEHDLISKKFNEPSAHFALICAAFSCPKLQTFSFTGINLKHQFRTITKDFFNNPLTFSLFKKDKKILISKIFDWYFSDFLYSPNNKKLSELINKKDVIKKYVIDNAPAEISDFVKQYKDEIQVDIMIWHWKLNETFN